MTVQSLTSPWYDLPIMARFTGQREAEIIRAYAAWDPLNCSAEELARQVGISKQSLYSVLHRNGVVLKTGRAPTTVDIVPDDILDRMAQQALRFLLDELVGLRAENERLRE